MKFEFKGTEDDGSEIVMRFEDTRLDAVLDRIEAFLKASGFCFNGELNIFDADGKIEGDL